MKIVSITHASDIDGVASAALIKMKYGVPSDRLFFTDYSEKGLAYAKDSLGKTLRGKERVVLFLADVGINDSLYLEFLDLVKSVKKRGGVVIWLDHHVWGGKELEEIAGRCDLAIVGENRKYCATEITGKVLGIGTNFTNRLVKIVHYSDFNITPRDRKIYDLVGVYAMSTAFYNTLGYRARDRGLRHIAEVLASGRFTDGKILRDARAFERLNNSRIAKMLKDLYSAGDGVSIGFSEDVQSTRACAAISEKTGADVSICVKPRDGKASIRSSIMDCMPLVKSLGGGGHPHAAGFKVDVRRFNHFRGKADRLRFAGFIEKKIGILY
jgi:uncharacterized protein